MGCSQELRITRPVWTDGTTTADNTFVPFHRVAVGKYSRLRVVIGMQSSTGAIKAVAAGALGNVDNDLASATPFDLTDPETTVSADGWDYTTKWVDLTALNSDYEDNQILWIGVLTNNVSGTKQETALVTLIIDLGN